MDDVERDDAEIGACTMSHGISSSYCPWKGCDDDEMIGSSASCSSLSIELKLQSDRMKSGRNERLSSHVAIGE
jgi:hypothetical protein